MALWNCGSDKAPGLDGFSFAFVKRFWDILKLDIFEFVSLFFTSCKMPAGSNSSFITLIPKVSNPIHINDFCPISLIGIHYKIIAKILANRLSKVIDKIVSHEQSTFIAGRQILDGPLMLSEMIDWYKNRKKKMLIFKVDFEKAFDSISWRYIDFVLYSHGFGMKWRSWIKECLVSSRTSILVNGSPTFEFSIKREWSSHDMDNIIRVLQVFYLASGLKINIHKSNVYGIGVSAEEVFLMANNTRCTSGSFPFVYLGLPICANMNNTSNWKLLLDRFLSRLSSWKANLLSIGGHLTLIKAVLGSLRIYYLSIFKAPEYALKAMERIRAIFFWGDPKIQKHLLRQNGLMSYPRSIKAAWVGCGTLIRFWKDTWQGNCPLCLRFNKLFLLEQDKDCLVIDRISNGQGCWNWSRSELGVRNEAYLRDLLNEISQVAILYDSDICVWSIAHDGVFSVGVTRRHIDAHLLPSLDPPTTWDKSLPRKVNIFMWRLLLDRLPHRLNLSSRGIEITEISCPSCNGNVESNRHIFFECDIAKDIWRLIRTWCEASMPSFDSHVHRRDWMSSWHVLKEKKHRMYVIIATSLWWIWRFRNNVIFNSHSMRKSDIFDNIRLYSFSWLKSRGRMFYSWADWLKSHVIYLFAFC
ncbi:RNA-directed DNA polymerase, eukaryota, reverse transcriptase zinc-binding domain protein [Tanacetum coccineum]